MHGYYIEPSWVSLTHEFSGGEPILSIVASMQTIIHRVARKFWRSETLQNFTMNRLWNVAYSNMSFNHKIFPRRPSYKMQFYRYSKRYVKNYDKNCRANIIHAAVSFNKNMIWKNFILFNLKANPLSNYIK